MSVYRDSPADALRAEGARLRSMSGSLAMPPERAAHSLAKSLARLGDNAALEEQIVAATGLDRAMVRWALSTTLDTMAERNLLALAESLPWLGGGAPARLAGVVLAGNVFTACLRALVVPLLYGVPVLARASARDDVLARALIAELDPPFAEAISLVHYPSTDRTRLRASLTHAETVHVFGSDDSVRAVRSEAPAHAIVVPHGHGVGVGHVDTRDISVDAAAIAFAIDVAAYDQRGCLSPHVIYVEGDASGFAKALANALEQVSARFPRGVVPDTVAAAQMQWRGTARALGELHDNQTSAVALEGSSPLPLGPGWRNALVRPVRDDVAFLDRVRPLGAHLKCIGVAGQTPTAIARTLSHAPGLWPRVCVAGTMQTPPLDLAPDGLPPWHGLLRVLETR